MFNSIPELKKHPHLLRAFDAEISALQRNHRGRSCSKCMNNSYLQIVRKYQKLIAEASKNA